MWSSIVGSLLGKVAPDVVGYYRDKQKLKNERVLERLRGKIEYEKAKSQRAAASEGYDNNWETQQIQNSGWKDEFTLLVLSIPMILVFFPPTAPYIADGFDKLQGTPDWYRWLVIMIYAATWGIRVWRRQSKII
jgi:hypothetical protein